VKNKQNLKEAIIMIKNMEVELFSLQMEQLLKDIGKTENYMENN